MNKTFKIDDVRSAVMALHTSRSDDNTDWLTVGMALRRLGDEGLQTWIDFSRNSDKFTEGECERRWQSFKTDGGYSPATIFKWAKLDSGWKPGKQTPVRQTPVKVVTVADDEKQKSFRNEVAKLHNEAIDLLSMREGKPGANFLLNRRLSPETWAAYRLGFYSRAALPDTEGKQGAPAIAIPWFDEEGQTVAIRYRFLERHEYINKHDKQQTEKMGAKWGSNYTGRLYGLHTLQGRDILVITEGEINCMSIWQATGGAVDVLSVGGESANVVAHSELISRYGLVILWFDKPKMAKDKAVKLRCKLGNKIHAIASPENQDANDLLKTGALRGFLSAHFNRILSGSST